MKKRPSTPTVQDQILSPEQSQDSQPSKPTPFVTRLGPTPLGKHRPVSYVAAEKPREEPLELPRLFIQGFGGSIKMDLQGVGVRLSQAVFAHMVVDDSLESIHVCRGDLALIEPVFRRFHDGNLILVDLDGRPSLRRLRKDRSCWMLELADQESPDPVPLANRSILGVVIGFVRLFNELKPVRYEGTEAKYCTHFEVPAQQSKPKRGARPNSRVNRLSNAGEVEADPCGRSAPEGGRKRCLDDFDEEARYEV